MVTLMKRATLWARLGFCTVFTVAMSNRLLVLPVFAQSSSQESKSAATVSPELQSLIQKSLDLAAAVPPGGDVRGFVELKSGVLEILLPKAKVFLKRVDDNSLVAKSTVETGVSGRFTIPRQPPGTYIVCAEAPDFEPACSDEQAEVSDHSVVLKLPIALKPVDGFIHGRALLDNGQPAVSAGMAVHTSSGTAKVSLLDAAGKRVAGPVSTNSQGFYVLTKIQPGSDFKLRAEYQGQITSGRLSLKQSDLQGGSTFEMVIPTKTPSRRPGKRGPAPAPHRPPAPAPGGSYSPPSAAGNFIDPTLFMFCANEAACEVEAGKYYQSIGVFDSSDQPTPSLGTLSAWKKFWGFSADPTKPAAGETRAVYYNNADLKLGRDMHCLGPRPNPANQAQVFVACYVTNFNDGHSGSNPAGGDPQQSVVNAESNTSPLATVAMVSQQSTVSPFGNNVSFYVYNGPDGSPLKAATLDSQGPKAVPGLCISCHGGNYVNDQTNNIHTVQNARFLPFDTPSFIFDNQNNAFLEPAQRTAFQQLNQMVLKASNNVRADIGNPITALTIQDLINGWYGWCGGASDPSCYIDDIAHPFIPSADCSANQATCGWTTATVPNSSFNAASFYQKVPRVYCRTCHVANSDLFNWQSFNKVSQNLPQVKSAVFTTHFMPFAEVPYNGFWFDFDSQDALRDFVNPVRTGYPSVTVTNVHYGSTHSHWCATAKVVDSNGNPVGGSVVINGKGGATNTEICVNACVKVTCAKSGCRPIPVACTGTVSPAGFGPPPTFIQVGPLPF